MSEQARDQADATAQEGLSEIEERGEAYRVTLPTFEGPLDLLLHLIQKHELNILDIPIGFVAEKYLEYIHLMDQLNIDLASEYLVMAATLVHIKSRSLLPADPHAGEDESALEEELDPRAELIRRLLEYQKYKHAAESLAERPLLGRDVFPRGAPAELSTDPAPLAPLSLFKLVDAFEAVLKRAKRVVEHEVDFERITITDKISQISELLKANGMMRFDQLFEMDVARAEMIVTFLALLEMTKLRMTRLRQDRPLDPIFVELAVLDEDAMPFDLLGDSELRLPVRAPHPFGFADELARGDLAEDDEFNSEGSELDLSELDVSLGKLHGDGEPGLDISADVPELEETLAAVRDKAGADWDRDALAMAVRALADDLDADALDEEVLDEDDLNASWADEDDLGFDGEPAVTSDAADAAADVPAESDPADSDVGDASEHDASAASDKLRQTTVRDVSEAADARFEAADAEVEPASEAANKPPLDR